MPRTLQVEHLDAGELFAALQPREAVAAISDALASGLDPGRDPERVVLDVPGGVGQLVTMPSSSTTVTGVKVVTVAPANVDRGLPRIQGLYLLFEHPTLRLVATMDGAALTALRTPAASVAAVMPLLAARPGPWNVTVFGAGPQGRGHVATLRDVGLEVASVTYVVREPSRVDVSALDGAALIPAPESRRATSEADLIVCATTSRVPVFDAHDVRDDAIVLAVGTHEPDAREVGTDLVRRAQVIVEDVDTAIRECGEVALAIREGALSRSDLIPMADVVRGSAQLDPEGPLLFKGSGMPWQDLVVAEAAARQAGLLT